MNNTEPFEMIMTGGGLIILVGFIIAILPIILFFKVWGMTNNVQRIMELIETKLDHDAKKEGLHRTPLNTLEQKEHEES